MFFKKQEISNHIKTIRIIENGFSIADLSIAITVIGILAVMVIPNISPALEFVEVLVAEKYLLKSVRECQSGLIKNDLSTQYDLPENNSGLGIFKNNKYLFSYTGNPGECINLSTLEENRIRITRSNISQNLEYSLISCSVNSSLAKLAIFKVIFSSINIFVSYFFNCVNFLI